MAINQVEKSINSHQLGKNSKKKCSINNSLQDKKHNQIIFGLLLALRHYVIIFTTENKKNCLLYLNIHLFLNSIAISHFMFSVSRNNNRSTQFRLDVTIVVIVFSDENEFIASLHLYRLHLKCNNILP